MPPTIEWLNGKKTYIGMIAAGLYGLAISAGWIEFADWEWLAVVIATWTGVAVTHKADKAISAVEKQKTAVVVSRAPANPHMN